jgi:hypothetical protein
MKRSANLADTVAAKIDELRAAAGALAMTCNADDEAISDKLETAADELEKTPESGLAEALAKAPDVRALLETAGAADDARVLLAEYRAGKEEPSMCMKQSTDDAKKVFARCLAEHQDELATIHGIPAADLVDLKNWKRTKKLKQETGIAREFSFRANSLLLASVRSDVSDSHFTSIFLGYWGGMDWRNPRQYYFPGGKEIQEAAERKKQEAWLAEQKQKAEATKAITAASPMEVLDKLRQNPIRVSLHAEGKRVSPDLTGRIIFFPPDGGENSASFDAESEENGDFGFMCGPEDEDHLADSDYCDQGLSELFADFGNKIDIGASENQHVVILILGVKASDLWSVIRERLIRSGAMPGKL